MGHYLSEMDDEYQAKIASIVRNPTVIEGDAEVEYQDSYMAASAVVAGGDVDVRLSSWREAPADEPDDEVKARHEFVNSLDGKRVRVTVEVLS